MSVRVRFPLLSRSLKEHLRQKLIDSGWRDNLKEYTMGAFARPPIFLRRSHHTSLTLPDPRLFIIRVSGAELIRSKGDQTMTVEQLTAEIIPRGRGTVPDEIKSELLQRIRRFAEQQS